MPGRCTRGAVFKTAGTSFYGRSCRAAASHWLGDEILSVAEKKAYPLRVSAEILEAMQRWSDDELRSLNAQIEYVLRDALRKSGRLAKDEGDSAGPAKTKGKG